MFTDGLMSNLLGHIEKTPDKTAFRYKRGGDGYRSMSYGESGKTLGCLSAWLADRGIGKGDRVAILAENSLYWALADLSVISLGAISVAIYPTLPARDVHYILENSESTIVFVQHAEQLAKVTGFPGYSSQISSVVVMEERAGEEAGKVFFMDDLIKGEDRPPDELKKRVNDISAEDPICIIYTSGTTGPPKGAVLTHGNIAAVNSSIKQMIGDDSAIKENLSFLPLSHALERIAGLFFSMNLGRTVAFAENLTTIVENMKEVHPSHAVAVPRVFEKIYERITTTVSKRGGLKKKIFWRQRRAWEEGEPRSVGGEEAGDAF